ncbi:MFS transporter [uncultured Roseobacter sp.]|uniref:MFS transporter n=1 Tax=uncultured Roseobacter sp. TaxID=114847 RepID=UPI00260899CC|nr:MFS transporter [uncultured Roseobacter sp.]
MRWRILSVIGLLYSAQFIPFFFAVMALPIVLRQEGHSATTIGLVQLAAIPYVFKFLWAPLIDRYKLGRDRYKSWIVLLSIIHVLGIVALAFTDPGGSLVPLFIALLIAALAVSTQDVAVDALAISLMRPSERTMGSTFQNAGAYMGAVVGGFGFLYIYDQIGWTIALLIQAVIFALPLFALVFVREPARLRGAPPATFRNALKFFKQEKMLRWLAILGTIRVPLLLTMLPMRLMMVDQGMSTEEIAVWFGLFAMCAGGGASAIFGPLLRNLPRVKAIYLVGLINIPVLLGVAFIAGSMPENIRYAIILAWVAIAMTDIVMFRGAMDKIRPEIPGFDFSVQVAIYMLIPGLMDPLVGYVIDTQGYLPAFLVAIPLALVPLVILYFAFARLRHSNQGLDGARAVSTGTMALDQPKALLAFCADEFTDHGISCSYPQPNLLRMEEMGCLVEMKALDGAANILIDTPTDNFLVFIREEIIEQLEKFDPDALPSLKWAGGLKVGEMPSNFRILRARRRREIHPGLIRVTLEGICVEAMTKDGIHIRLMMPEDRNRSPVWPVINENGSTSWPQGKDKLHTRYVTVRDIRPDEREIDVDIAQHMGGLISDWATLQGDEQEIGVMGPAGDSGLTHTQNVILAGDATGLPAIARLIESVGGEITGHVFAAAPSQAALEAYLPKSKMKVCALDPDGFSEEVAERLENCTAEPVSYGWFAGEFEAAQSVRKVFKQTFGLDKRTQLSVAYWRAGAPGHQSRAL